MFFLVLLEYLVYKKKLTSYPGTEALYKDISPKILQKVLPLQLRPIYLQVTKNELFWQDTTLKKLSTHGN